MLLRQLYLAHFELRRFAEAFAVTEQSLGLGVLVDVLHQDAARAAAAAGDIDAASRHLRTAARVGPPARKAFHWWTLGSLYFLADRHADAIGALERAARWGTRDKPLYQGHLALAQLALSADGGLSAAPAPDGVALGELCRRLAAVPAGQGYGRFVLGMLSYHRKRWADARLHLSAFVERTEGGRLATAIALHGELALARRILGRLPRDPA